LSRVKEEDASGPAQRSFGLIVMAHRAAQSEKTQQDVKSYCHMEIKNAQ
jgi:hypothetical protein